jgi:hypothetical protein
MQSAQPLRTELVMAGATANDAGRPLLNLPSGHEFDLGRAESPRFTGGAVVALTSAPDLLERSGRAFTTRDLRRPTGSPTSRSDRRPPSVRRRVHIRPS